MTKEHKKLYKAGKNWIVATLTATTITLLGGIGAYTVHADTTIESSQDVQTTSVNQTNQVDNSNNSVTLNNNQPVAVQSSQTAQNDQSVQGNKTNQAVPSSASAAADTSNSDSLDSNIYGTVNVKDWDYQNDSNIFNLTSYHGQDTRHIIVPNLNDFDNAGVKIGNATGVGISSHLARSLASQSLAFAISKTSGKYSDKVTATDNDWSRVFYNTGLINADVSNLDTRNITNMDSLFAESTGLKTVGDLSHWDTSNVITMSWMFYKCKGVTSDLSHWDTSNVRDMSGMLAECKGVTGDLSHWDTSNVRDMSDMFTGSSASVSGLNTWNIRPTTNMSNMFLGSSLPYKIVASNEGSIIPNQVTLKDNTGKFLAIIDTPTIYDSNKSVRSIIDGIVQAEIDKLNKLNHTLYETPKIISDGDDDYSIANATYVVNNESPSKTGLINYVDQDGKIVKTDQVSGKVGDKVDVKLSLPDGYELANKDEQVPSVITVTENGIGTINVNVKKIPVIKTGTINYIAPDGKIVKTDQVSGKVGDKVDVKLSLPDGYELANKDEQVPSVITITENGIGTINVNVKKIPVIKTGTINYIAPDGKIVKTDQVSGKVGDKVDVKLSLPDGYELANKDEQVPSVITVTENGIGTINVNVKKIPVIKTGTINYIAPDGKIVKTDQVSGKVGDKVDVKLSLPDGYELANKDEQVPSVITVTENGIGTINVNVKKIPVIKTGTINYIAPDGKIVKTDQVSGKVGDKVDVKLSLPDGYELANKDEQVPSVITVTENGIGTINVNVKKIPVIKTGTINYIAPDGKIVKTDQVSGKVGDKVDVKLSLPDGYELANKDEQVPSVITVTENGIGTINVNVKKIPVIKTGTINYIAPDGKIVKTDQVSGKVGDKVDVKLSLPDGYELANKDEQVPSVITVTENGIGTINVNVKKIPVIKTGTINYIAPDGKIVKTDQVSGKVGDKVDVKLSLPDGYELANKDEQVPSVITVTENGIGTINVNVKKIPVIKTGTINYIAPDGKIVKTDQVSGKVGDKVDVKLSLPDGYELANKDEQVPSVITVTENGIGTINVNVKKINTTLANNEVPYDSTTVSNNENANYGYLDSYKLTENNQGQAQLIASGWHATGASNSDRYRYMIVFDNTLGHEIARQKLVPQVRSDVQRAYSNVDNSLYSGFNVTIDIPNSCINHSLRLVSRYSNDPNHGEGARVDYWFNSLALNEDNQAYLDKLSANGDTLTVTGWHATNQAAGRPYHYIIAWDRNLGHEIARQRVTAVSRPDVAKAYSTVANAVNSGFSVKFNLTPQFFNDNIQFISRWTDDAAGNGNAVDYWFKPMNRTNRANLDSVTLSNGQVRVAGWHATDLSQLEPNHYLIVFDNTTGQQVASEKVDLLSSQDVKNVFGDIQTADHSRFNYTFNSLHLIPGHNYSLVSRYSADANGNGNDGAHTDSWLNMGTFQQSAYSIDHVALNRRHMTVQGWVANDNAMTRPYAYAILLQNGHEIGRQRLNLSERADVAKVYPQIYRSQYSGFNTSFDLPTASTNGLQLVLRFTDDPAGNGNSSDKWINL